MQSSHLSLLRGWDYRELPCLADTDCPRSTNLPASLPTPIQNRLKQLLWNILNFNLCGGRDQMKGLVHVQQAVFHGAFTLPVTLEKKKSNSEVRLQNSISPIFSSVKICCFLRQGLLSSIWPWTSVSTVFTSQGLKLQVGASLPGWVLLSHTLLKPFSCQCSHCIMHV